MLLTVLIAGATSCRKPLDKDAPSCLHESIKKLKKSMVASKNASITEFLFQEKLVYLIDGGCDCANCCADMSVGVVDSDCNIIGELGGFFGKTIINGEQFSNAEYIRTVWSE